MAQGGNGCISVTSNVAPGLCRSVYLALKRGQSGRAQSFAAAVMTLTVALFSETSPAPLKYALSLLNVMSARVRLLLVEPSDASKAQVASALRDLYARYPERVIGSLAFHGVRSDSAGMDVSARAMAS